MGVILNIQTLPDWKMAWHKGTWWPLYVKEWYAPKSSQHMFDPYSFCLLVLGLLFQLFWGTDDCCGRLLETLSMYSRGSGIILALLENIAVTPFKIFWEISSLVVLGTSLVQCFWS